MNMKRILRKKVSEATAPELLLVLMHTNGVDAGPGKIVHAEPVLETLITIDADSTARLLVFKDDLEILKTLCNDDLALYGRGTPKTLDELSELHAPSYNTGFKHGRERE